MPEINDIEKLRPELLDKSVAELDRMAAEIEMAKAKKAEQEAEKRRQAEYQESIGLTEELVKIVTRLHDIGRLPPRVATALSNAEGEFRPGLYIKKPRS